MNYPISGQHDAKKSSTFCQYLDYDDGDRQGRLRGKVSEGTFEGQSYIRWQIDVNGASSIWYFVDATVYGVKKKRRGGRVIIDQIYFGHPKQTE